MCPDWCYVNFQEPYELKASNGPGQGRMFAKDMSNF